MVAAAKNLASMQWKFAHLEEKAAEHEKEMQERHARERAEEQERHAKAVAKQDARISELEAAIEGKSARNTWWTGAWGSWGGAWQTAWDDLSLIHI